MCDYRQSSDTAHELAKKFNEKVGLDGLFIYTEQSAVHTEYIRSIEVNNLQKFLNDRLKDAGEAQYREWLIIDKMFEQLFLSYFDDEQPADLVDPVLTIPKFVSNSITVSEISKQIAGELARQVKRSLDVISKYIDDFQLVVQKQTLPAKGRKKAVTRWKIMRAAHTYYLSDRQYEKLVTLYRSVESNDESKFDSDLYKMLARYNSIDSKLLYTAVPYQFLRYIYDQFGVQHICFSSPLDVMDDKYYYSTFYPDVDSVFGSSGNYFQLKDIYAAGGFFLVNPPTIPTVVDAAVIYLLDWIDDFVDIPLSFVLIVPAIEDSRVYEMLAQYEDMITYDTVITDKDKCRLRLLIIQNDLGADTHTIDEGQVLRLDELYS